MNLAFCIDVKGKPRLPDSEWAIGYLFGLVWMIEWRQAA